MSHIELLLANRLSADLVPPPLSHIDVKANFEWTLNRNLEFWIFGIGNFIK